MKRSHHYPQPRNYVLPIAVFFALASTLAGAWWKNLQNRRATIRVKTEITAGQIGTRLEEFFGTRLRVLDMFRMEWDSTGPMNQSGFTDRSLQIQSQFSGLQALNWVDSNGVIRWVVPFERNRAALGHDLHKNPNEVVRAAIGRASNDLELALTTPVPLVQGGMGLTTYYPLVRNGQLEGFLNGVFSVRSIVSTCLSQEITDYYHLEISHGDIKVFVQEEAHTFQSDRSPVTTHFRVGDQTWNLLLAPKNGAEAGSPTTLDLAVLILGLALSFGLALLIRATLVQSERLVSSEIKYRLLFQRANDGILVIERDRVVDCNERALELFGTSRDQIMTNPPFFWSPPRQPDGNDSHNSAGTLLRTAENGQPSLFEWLYQRQDGSTFYADISLNAFEYQGQNLTLALVRDVSERKLAENALRESEEKYRQLVENAHDAIFIVQDNRIKFPNPSTCKLAGYQPEELQLMDIVDLIDPRDRMKVAKHYASQRRHAPFATYAFRILNGHGESIWAEISTVLISWEDKPATLNIIRNVSDQKDLEARLREAQRLEALGTLAGGVAHDFNNLLMGIQGNASILIREYGESHPLVERLHDIETLVQSGSDLTRQLLGFARGGSYEVRPISLNNLVERTTTVFARTHKELKIHQQYSSNDLVVNADGSQIERVILNILVNAWQAMPKGGDMFVTGNSCDLDEFFCQPFKMVPGPYAHISIQDTGIGMEPSVQQRIFEPFYTHKYQHRGTGLGLASAYGIVRAHLGVVTVESELGSGSCFHIFLPLCTHPIEATAQPESKAVTGSGLVLLVDDEREVLEVIANMIEALGYHVLRSASGAEALKIFAQEHHAIDLVIIDMIMPDLSGLDLFDHLTRIDPQVRVILSSGYSLHGQARQLMDRGCLGYIQKPFRMEELSEKIRQVLDAPVKGESVTE